jgi:uncharacterized membrane protein YfcA
MLELNIPWILLPLFFIVAFLYSSVGHGGASGYLALFALAGIARAEIAPVVLILNVIVSLGGFVNYYRAKHFSVQLILPFVLTSIPAAFFGGMMKVSSSTFALLLGVVLVLASIRLFFIRSEIESRWKNFSGNAFYIGLPLGLVIGFLSGITGIGGGIFLSPLLLLSGWADAKKVAAASAAFIILNSLSGLIAKSFSATINWNLVIVLGMIVVLGGQLGSRLGAYKFNPKFLQKILAVVLLLAGLKMFWDAVT